MAVQHQNKPTSLNPNEDPTGSAHVSLDNQTAELTQLILHVQEWAQRSGKRTDELAEDVNKALRLLDDGRAPHHEASTSWLKRVRSGRLLKALDTTGSRVDARYSALLLLVAVAQLSGTGQRTSSSATLVPEAIKSSATSLQRQWEHLLLSHWGARTSREDSNLRDADPIHATKAFSIYLQGADTPDPDLQELGRKIGKFLVNAAVSPADRETALTRTRWASSSARETAKDVVTLYREQEGTPGRTLPKLRPAPMRLEGQPAYTNRLIRNALGQIQRNVAEGALSIGPYMSLAVLPVIDQLVEISCQLRNPDEDGEPTVFLWLSALVGLR